MQILYTINVMKIVAKNPRARYDYQITEELLAGIILSGPEVKSVKAGAVSIKGSYVAIKTDGAYLLGAHISPYGPAGSHPQEPERIRKLLLNRRELEQIAQQKQAGLSIVPTAIGIQRNLVKVELGIGRGQKHYDKRDNIKKREQELEAKRKFKAI